MEVVKAFNDELSSLYEGKPPISKAKMNSITRTAIKAIKFYKHVVQSVEKFIQKCKPEYKVPGLYVIDSIVRQSRHQFGTEKDVFAPRFARNLKITFSYLFNCPPEDKSKVIRVLNLWQKNSVFESDVIQSIFDMADPSHPIHKELANTTNGLTNKNNTSAANSSVLKTPNSKPSQSKSDTTPSWLANLSSVETPNNSLLAGVSSSDTPNKQVPNFMDPNMLAQQLQHLHSLILNQTSIDTNPVKKDNDQVKFDKKLLDFDYGDEEDDDIKTSPAQAPALPSAIDSLGSILGNPEVLKQLQNLQLQMSQQQQLRQQSDDEKQRKLQEMKQQEEEFDKHLAQTLPNLPFANECDFKLNTESSTNVSHQTLLQQYEKHQQAQSMATFKGVDISQPPPGYSQINQTSPLEDGERANSDVDERHAGIRNWVSDAVMRSQNLNRINEGEGNAPVVVIDSESPSDSPRARKSRRYSRSSSRSRSKRKSRSRSNSRSRSKRRRSRSYDKDKDYDRDWDRSSKKEFEKEKERKRKGLPPLKKTHLSVCSTTLWIGHLSRLVQQEELSDTFGEYGYIVSIDLIPPRGCAFICMNRRQDAHRALQHLKYHKLQGKMITLAWAPGKGMKGKEWKDYWEVDQGVSYIPWSKINQDTDLELLEEGGMFDEESFPDWLKKKIETEKLKLKNKSEKHKNDKPQEEHKQLLEKPNISNQDDNESKKNESIKEDDSQDQPNHLKEAELDIPVPGPSLPGYIPLPDGPQPDLKVTPPAAMPPLSLPPMGMMPPFGLPNVTRIMGPMGMAMGPGLMTNVPLGMPPPGLMGSPLMHQQMMQRMPQPVNSPFNAHPLLQMPFSLPPQLQLNQVSHSLTPKPTDTLDLNDANKNPKIEPNPAIILNNPFSKPPPNFTSLSLQGIQLVPPTTSSPAVIIPPTSIAPPSITILKDKDERELKDKDFRDKKHFGDIKDKEKERDRDYRNRNKDRDYRSDRDYRGDKDYRNRNDKSDKDYRGDKDYREKDKDYRAGDKDYRERADLRKDQSSKEKVDDRPDEDLRPGKENEDNSKHNNRIDDKNNRDRRDSHDKDRIRERSRERERERDKDRDRPKRRNRWSDKDKREEKHGGDDKHNQQQPPWNRDMNEPPPNRDHFNPEGPRSLLDLPNIPPPDSSCPMPVIPAGLCPPRGPPPLGMRLTDGPPPPFLGPRGPGPGGPPLMFGPRGPPPPQDGFGMLDREGRHRIEGNPDDYEMMRMHGEEGFGRGMPPRGMPPPNNRGPPDIFEPMGPPPMEGFGPPRFEPRGPPEGFEPRIRIEFFPRGRGIRPDNFGPRMMPCGPMGPMFPPRGPVGPLMRGPRPPGIWDDGPGGPPRGPPGGPPRGPPGFPPPRGFPLPDMPPEEFNNQRLHGGIITRGPMRGRFIIRPDRRGSRWSSASPPTDPSIVQEKFNLDSLTTIQVTDSEAANQELNVSVEPKDLVEVSKSRDDNSEKNLVPCSTEHTQDEPLNEQQPYAVIDSLGEPVVTAPANTVPQDTENVKSTLYDDFDILPNPFSTDNNVEGVEPPFYNESVVNNSFIDNNSRSEGNSNNLQMPLNDDIFADIVDNNTSNERHNLEGDITQSNLNTNYELESSASENNTKKNIENLPLSPKQSTDVTE